MRMRINACNGNIFVMNTYPPDVRKGEKNDTPCSDHVKVEQGSKSTPECRPRFQRTNPQKESEHEQEYRNSLIIIRSSNRSRNISYNQQCKGTDITRGNSNKSS